MTNENKTGTSFRLSSTTRLLIDAIAEDAGISQASVVEMAVRDLAKARKIKLPSAKK